MDIIRNNNNGNNNNNYDDMIDDPMEISIEYMDLGNDLEDDSDMDLDNDNILFY